MRKLICLLIITLSLPACGSITLTMPYSPQSTEEIKGAISVSDFRYFPKDGVAQNQIHNTAAGKILLTDSVGSFWADAVRREFRQSGISLKDGSCRLEGEVTQFTLDDLGFNVDYITDVRYILYDSNSTVLFDNTFQVKFRTSKFLVADAVFANINKSVYDNIEQLLQHKTFLDMVCKHCKRLAQDVLASQDVKD